METNTVIAALGALAQRTRLGIFKALLQAGPQGLNAGSIGERLGIAPNAVSFHMKTMTQAGLALVHQEGRHVIYRADYARMTRLLQHLTEQCCTGPAAAWATLTDPAPRAKRAAAPSPSHPRPATRGSRS